MPCDRAVAAAADDLPVLHNDRTHGNLAGIGRKACKIKRSLHHLPGLGEGHICRPIWRRV
jgi:hypothetical protein